MARLALSIATNDYDRVRALKEGRVPVEGCDVTHLTLAPGELFFRLFTYREFDVAEMSLSTYMLARAKGDWPYQAIPVFLSRAFAHGGIYVRADAGIRAPSDLVGRTLGVPSYHFTRGLAARGLLADEYGVTPDRIRWRVGGVDTPERFDYVAMPAPPSVDLAPIEPGTCLVEHLCAGAIDGIVSYRDPALVYANDARIVRLFPDFRAAERDYYGRTSIFPIMHVLGVRTALVERHPWLARSLMKAFTAAKDEALARLDDLDAPVVTLPWVAAEAQETARLMGRDFWPYGIQRNLKTLEAQTRWAHAQGLVSERPAPEELFVGSTRTWYHGDD